jgi:hypothetical protein
MVIDVKPRPWWAAAYERAAELVLFVGVGLVVAAGAWIGLAKMLRAARPEYRRRQLEEKLEENGFLEGFEYEELRSLKEEEVRHGK